MAPESAFDVVVIGAGHNGLIAASYLAAAGKRTLVLEQRQTLGGLAGSLSTSQPSLSACSEVTNQLLPQVVRDLSLEKHGLQYEPLDPLALVLSESEAPFALWRETDRRKETIRKRSQRDASRYDDFAAQLRSLAKVLSPVLAKPPPQPNVESGAELFDLLRLGLSVRTLGARQTREVLRTFALSASDYLNEWFELEPLKAAIAASAISGLSHGPRSVGTAAKLIFQHASTGFGPLEYRASIRGGVATMGNVLASAAKASGAELRAGSRVHRIERRKGGVAVVLQDGSVVHGSVAISNAAPRTTFLELTDPTQYSPEFIGEIQNIRHRGVTAVMNLLLDTMPEVEGVKDPAELRGVLQIGASLETLERAYDATKYGEISEHPVLIMKLVPMDDGKRYLLNLQAQFAPYALREGDWNEKRDPFAEQLLSVVERHIPKLRSRIVEQHLVTPADYELEFSQPEGQWDQAEMTLDQLLFMRPAPGWARYRTPLDGLYICGAGSHPGGGLIGACGRNAARQVLLDEQKA